MSDDKFVVKNWQHDNYRTRIGECSVQLQDGMVIHNVGIHQDQTNTWCTLPAHKWTGTDGKLKHQALVEFATRQQRNTFQDRVLAAVAEFLGRDQQ